MATFSPPTVNDIPRVLPETRGVAYRLMRHFSNLPRGRSVLKTAGVYRTVDVPSQTDIDAASEVYLGGHVYTVTQDQADALAAAGYVLTDYTPGGTSNPGFGEGGFGEGQFGA